MVLHTLSQYLRVSPCLTQFEEWMSPEGMMSIFPSNNTLMCRITQRCNWPSTATAKKIRPSSTHDCGKRSCSDNKGKVLLHRAKSFQRGEGHGGSDWRVPSPGWKPSSGKFPTSSLEMPITYFLQLGPERFRAPEILFNPELIGQEYAGVHQVVVDSINRVDLDLRKSLFSNIVLSGGSTLCKGP